MIRGSGYGAGRHNAPERFAVPEVMILMVRFFLLLRRYALLGLLQVRWDHRAYDTAQRYLALPL